MAPEKMPRTKEGMTEARGAGSAVGVRLHGRLTTDDWGLATGDWRLGTGDWGLATGDWRRAERGGRSACEARRTDHSPSEAVCRCPTTDSRRPTRRVEVPLSCCSAPLERSRRSQSWRQSQSRNRKCSPRPSLRRSEPCGPRNGAGQECAGEAGPYASHRVSLVFRQPEPAERCLGRLVSKMPCKFSFTTPD
jgi:hypothetical protein